MQGVCGCESWAYVGRFCEQTMSAHQLERMIFLVLFANLLAFILFRVGSLAWIELSRARRWRKKLRNLLHTQLVTLYMILLSMLAHFLSALNAFGANAGTVSPRFAEAAYQLGTLFALCACGLLLRFFARVYSKIYAKTRRVTRALDVVNGVLALSMALAVALSAAPPLYAARVAQQMFAGTAAIFMLVGPLLSLCVRCVSIHR